MTSSITQATGSFGALRILRATARGLGRLSRGFGPVLAAGWYALIYGLSSRETYGRPGPISGSWALNTGHSLLFGILALWLLLCAPRREGWPRVGRGTVFWVLGSVLTLGVLDELHQSRVPGRTMSATDVLTDLTGAACVLWICAYGASAAASERGARLRLCLGVLACAGAGAIATLADNHFP